MSLIPYLNSVDTVLTHHLGSSRMSTLHDVTPLILTYNEEDNISRTINALSWAKRIVVVDSHSSDRTLDLLSNYPTVEIFQRSFDTHATQWNYGLDQISDGWVLTLDADYLICPDLLMEMSAAIESADDDNIHGFRIPFRYCVFGRPIRGTVLPPRLALFRRASGTYVDDGHTQDLCLQGKCASFRIPILHDDRKPLTRWLWAQHRYLKLETHKLTGSPLKQLGLADRLRLQTFLAPLAVLFLCLIWHRGIFDGWRGFYYAFQRMYVETLLKLMLCETSHHP